jgi:DNA repair exonuclease SbcCD ATPase subunit
MYRVLLTEADRSMLGEADNSTSSAAVGGGGVIQVSEESQREMAKVCHDSSHFKSYEAKHSILAQQTPNSCANTGPEVLDASSDRPQQNADLQELERLRKEGQTQNSELQKALDAARKEATNAKIAAAQAQSDLSYLQQRHAGLEGTSQAQAKELAGERQRLEGVLGRNETLEQMLSQHMSDSLSAQVRIVWGF